MKYKMMLLAIFLLALASPMFAQGTGAAANGGDGNGLRLLGAYIAMGIASGFCGVGQGKATASAAEAVARNPGAITAIRFFFIFGMVLIESLALYTLVITFIVSRT